MTSGSAGTKGFLFCDLRGYTAFVEHEGDRAAAELLETYRTLVRAVIAAHEGAEIRTEGDSVYVVFPTASSAVEAGLAIVAGAAEASTKDRPVRVGVGIHAGETLETTEGPVGGAVNIAARVCAKAQAGEVLVTETVRALTRTFLPYRFVGLGSQALKGIPGGIALYRVEAVPASRLAHLRRRLVARRRRVALVVSLVALVAVGATGAWALNRPPDCLSLPASTADVVARIDPARMCVVQVIPVGRRPDSIVATADAVWVANETDWTVTRIDLASRRPSHTLGVPGAPISVAAQPTGRVDVLAFDDRTNAGDRTAESGLPHRVVMFTGPDARLEMAPALFAEGTLGGSLQEYVPDSSYTALAASNGRTWVVSRRGGLVRLLAGDAPGAPGRTQVTKPDTPTWGGAWNPRPTLIAAAGGTVWVADEEGPELYRFDGQADAPTSVVTVGGPGARALAASPAEVWLLGKDDSLARVDVATNAQVRLASQPGASALAIGPDSLWLLDDATRTVRSVDPTSGGTTSTVPVGGVPANAVFADGALWVTVHGP